LGGLAGLVALCSAAGWRTAPALASREALRGLPASPLFGIAGQASAASCRSPVKAAGDRRDEQGSYKRTLNRRASPHRRKVPTSHPFTSAFDFPPRFRRSWHARYLARAADGKSAYTRIAPNIAMFSVSPAVMRIVSERQSRGEIPAGDILEVAPRRTSAVCQGAGSSDHSSCPTFLGASPAAG